MTTTETQPGDSRRQVLNLIDFLSAYDAQRNPPIRRIDDHGMFRLAGSKLPTHPAVRLRPTEQVWLSVDFLDLPAQPVVPALIAALLVGGTAVSATAEPELIDPPETEQPPADAPAVIADKDSSAVTDPDESWAQTVAPAQAWIEQTWRPWSVAWSAAQEVKQLHRSLFEQRERLALDRDAVELVWGFGRLRWTAGPEDAPTTVDHPLLTVPVEIDAAHGSEQLMVRPAGPLEVEGRLLIGLDVHDRNGYTAIRQTISGDPIDPWIDPDRDQILRRLVRAVDDQGALAQSGSPGSANATVDSGWTIFLRRRVPDSEGFLQAMRELYRDDLETIPPPLRSILTLEEQLHSGEDGGGFGGSETSASSDPLLLPLPANEQQQRILQLAQRHPGVSVQGPPGTGKSHTIANLISHYVAYGKRVLVVAEKEQALKVLADKVPEGIRDLTVSVLGADEEGRRRLGQSISRIQSRVGQVDRAAADIRIVELTATLDGLDRRYAEVTTQLLRTRQAEITELPGSWLAASPLTPQAAAGWVADRKVDLGYIPDSVIGLGPPPITAGELGELIELIRTIGPERARLAGDVLPDRGQLSTPQQVQRQIEQIAELNGRANRARQLLRDWTRIIDTGAEKIQVLANDLANERDWYVKLANSWLGAVLAQLGDPLLVAEWAGFLADLTAARERAIGLRARLRAYTVQLPEPQSPQFITDLTSARDKLAGGGKLGVFARDAKRAMDSCRIDGAAPQTVEQVQLCLDHIEVEKLRHSIANTWSNQTRHLGASPLTGFPEQSVRERLDEVAEVQSANQRWADLRRQLESAGLPLAARPSAEALDQAAAVCLDAVAALQQSALRAQLEALRQVLMTGASGSRPSPEWLKLADAVGAGDSAAYRQHWDVVGQLEQVAGPAARLTHILDRLAAAAPEWAGRISRDPDAARRPSDLSAAWQWRQLETWLQQIRSLPDPAQLQSNLEELAAERRRTVTELVTERAWRRLADNLGHRERQALQSYVAAVTRYGKTGGKFAQRWIAEMRAALDDAKTAVPVWIMPTARALSSFRPTAITPFDVLVIDEASQIGFEALPLLALASSTIVVGDDKQTSPEHVGLDRERIFHLMDDYLREIPRYKTVFDPDRSLYDLATLRFSTPVMLTEHFRCLPEIIAFSNHQAYGDQIIPLRDQPPHPGWVPLGLIRVMDGYRTGFVNEPEAAQVVSLISELCDNPQYDGMTFGVISLLGTAQSKRIWDLLYDQLGPDIVAQRQIRCGEAANFQGDERDVMVLTTVIAIDPSAANTRFGAMTGTAALRRINVAASRARNQMWVVTSVDPQTLSAGDLRAELIRHCSAPPAVDERRADLLAACESDFERRVVRSLQARGYRAIEVQHRVGQYRLDIVVAGPNGRLAIECDGDRWHGEDVWHRDRARQEVLERAGWTFERVRGSSYYRDPDVAMQPVWRHLEKLGIPTGDEWMVTAPRGVTREVSGPPPERTPEPAHSTRDGELPAIDEPELDEPTAESAESTDLPPTEQAPPAAASPSSLESAPEQPAWSPPSWFLAGRGSDDQPAEEEPSVVTPTAAGPVASPAASTSSSNDFSPPDWYRPPSSSASTTAVPSAVSTPVVHHEPPVSGASAGPILLAPYRSWTSRSVPPLDLDDREPVMAGLSEIIKAEGPMHARRAHQLYVRASGGHRVGPESQRVLNALTARGVRTGLWLRVKDRQSDPAEATLYSPDNLAVIVRERGPRELSEIPRSEIRTLVDLLGLTPNDPGVKRAILNELGFVRLTERTKEYLDQCLRYTWTV